MYFFKSFGSFVVENRVQKKKELIDNFECNKGNPTERGILSVEFHLIPIILHQRSKALRSKI